MKILAWLQIVLCCIILISFIGTIIGISPTVISQGGHIDISVKEILIMLLGFVFFTAISIMGLRNGIRKLRPKKTPEVMAYDDILDIQLNGKIEYVHYRNLVLGLTFNKPMYYVTFGILVLFVVAQSVNTEWAGIDSVYVMALVALTMVIISLSTVIRVRNQYIGNKLFREKLTYRLNNDSIHVKGSTVDSILYWNHFYKVKETKRFFMFYHDEMLATMLEKKMFTDAELKEFKRFILSLKMERE